MTVLFIVTEQNKCLVYCDRTNTFHCCSCNGIATTSTTTTTTTTTTTPAPSGDGSGGGGCFPSTAKVKLESSKLVTMSELQIDDQTETGRILRAVENIHQFCNFTSYFLSFYLVQNKGMCLL